MISITTVMKDYLNAKLLFSDTDSFNYYIETDDVYKDIKGNPWFDFSNYVEVTTILMTVKNLYLDSLKMSLQANFCLNLLD